MSPGPGAGAGTGTGMAAGSAGCPPVSPGSPSPAPGPSPRAAGTIRVIMSDRQQVRYVRGSGKECFLRNVKSEGVTPGTPSRTSSETTGMGGQGCLLGKGRRGGGLSRQKLEP